MRNYPGNARQFHSLADLRSLDSANAQLRAAVSIADVKHDLAFSRRERAWFRSPLADAGDE